MTPVSVNVDAGIGRITLDRPEQLNAVNVELSVELERAILVLGSDPTIQVIVVFGLSGNLSQVAISVRSSDCGLKGGRRCGHCSFPSGAPAMPSSRLTYQWWPQSKESPQRGGSNSCRPRTS